MDSFSWSAVLDLGSEEMRKALSNTSSEDRFWGLTRVYMLVQRVYWKSVQQHWISTWTWTAMGNIMSISVPATLVV
jgi:hypothetical protein